MSKKEREQGASTVKTECVIAPARLQSSIIKIRGTAPLVMNAFSAKAREMMRAKQIAGMAGSKKKHKEPKDFERLYEEAIHRSVDGWAGIPDTAFRAAMVSACRLVGFKMTIAKLSIQIIADGFDDSGGGLVKITKGTPRPVEHPVRNATGVADLRVRPMWDPGWEAELHVCWDADQFTGDDVVNLLERAGKQVGICEGRPDSKQSTGMGWGLFTVLV